MLADLLRRVNPVASKKIMWDGAGLRAADFTAAFASNKLTIADQADGVRFTSQLSGWGYAASLATFDVTPWDYLLVDWTPRTIYTSNTPKIVIGVGDTQTQDYTTITTAARPEIPYQSNSSLANKRLSGAVDLSALSGAKFIDIYGSYGIAFDLNRFAFVRI